MFQGNDLVFAARVVARDHAESRFGNAVEEPPKRERIPDAKNIYMP
jgi:hypothetical protein